jgi:DNA-binding GntR family transcriptional regulator
MGAYGKDADVARRKPDDSIASRVDQAYDGLAAAIRNGRYRPGDRLREEEIAADLGMSRTPVREALGRLATRGLVEARAGRGLVVTSLSAQSVLELYAMREVLEGTAARLAAQQATDVEIEALTILAEDFARTKGAPAAFAQTNRVFHARLYDAARNRFLLQALNDLQDAIGLLPRTTFAIAGRAAAAIEEHAAIVAAMRARNPDAADKAARAHIRAALKARLTDRAT